MKRIIYSVIALVGLVFMAGCSKPAPTAPPNSDSPPLIAPDESRSPNKPVNPEANVSQANPQPSSSPPIEYKDARKQVESATKANPGSYEIQIDAARFYMQSGDHTSAIPHLQKATNLAPGKILPWIALGDAATLSGHFTLAAQAYQHARTIEPQNADLARGQSQLLILQKKFNEARILLETSLLLHPHDIETSAALGNLYLVLNKPRKAIETLQPASILHPDRADIHLLLGEALERDLRLEAAITEMRAAVNIEPRMVEAWGRLGLYLINLTRYKEAREPLEHALALEPNEGHYYWALGDSYLLDTTDHANLDKAVELYRIALKHDPKNDKALYSFAMALTRRGNKQDLEEAIQLLKRLISINPIDTNAEYKLAETYQRIGKPQEARLHRARFDILFARGRAQTRHLFAETAVKDTAIAHLESGQKAMKLKQYGLASQEFQAALQMDRTLSTAREGLNQAQLKAGLISNSGQKTKP